MARKEEEGLARERKFGGALQQVNHKVGIESDYS